MYHLTDRPTELTGFEVEFAGALCAQLGVRSEFVQNNWDMLVPALQEGSHFDVIIAGLERSPENLAKIDMSRPYFIYGQQLVVPASDTRTARLEELRGKRVGVLSASGSHHLAERAGGIDVRIYQDNVNYFSDLEVGRLDAVLTDTPIALANLKEHPALRSAGAPFALGAYAVGVRSTDPDLLRRINEAIGALASDGSLERIYRKYSLWNSDQAALREWHEESTTVAPRRHSVLREWRTYLPFLLEASVTTIWVTCGGMVLAATWGLVLALLRLYGPAPVRWLSVAYIEVFRGTPLLLQIYFIYFGLAQQLGLRLSAGAAAVLSLGLNYAASEAENYRAGIQAVPRGQTEAALALGMSRSLMLRRVILPQSLRISLPSVTNDFIAMFKDSSIVSVIALVELTKAYQIRAIDTGDYIGLGILTAAIYFTLSYAASQGARWLERRMHRDSR
ncbi:MAG: ABC transporter substrate-binding protein/permease [Verrucomicrobiota bacterium]